MEVVTDKTVHLMVINECCEVRKLMDYLVFSSIFACNLRSSTS